MKKRIYTLLMVIFFVIFIISAGMLLKYFLDSRKSQNAYDDIRNQVTNSEEPMDKFAALYAQNNDFIGWIKIEGTTIDYPVMQTKNDPEYYLYRNFQKEDSAHGTPFVDAACDIDASDQTIIYGHHMKDGTMFRPLENYSDLDFYNNHKIIQFDTLNGNGRYEVMAVFRTSAGADGFPFYQFINAGTPEDFDHYVNEVKAIAEYDTGITAAHGDKLIALSTCEYTHEDGRLVIVAKKIG